MKTLLVTGLSMVFLVTAAGGVYAADAPPGERVVCVSKQINEFIYAIGAESHLVARDLTSIYPPQITKLPSVGYHRALSAEGIISMRPSVFLTDGNVGPKPVLDQLRKVGIPIKIISPGKTMQDAQHLLSQLGKYFNRQKAAAKVLAGWKKGMANVRRIRAKWANKPHPRVLLIHFGQIINDYLAVNRGTPASKMIKWAGGINVIKKQGGMTRLTPELIAKAAPDVIIANNVAFDRYGSVAKFKKMPGVGLTPAAKAGRIYRVDESAIIYFTPHTPQTVRKLAAMFHS